MTHVGARSGGSHRRLRGRVLAGATALVALTSLASLAVAHAPDATGGRVAGAFPVDGRPEVGALRWFGQSGHSCSASMLHSRTHDLLLTAAHCVPGDPTHLSFMPATVNGSAPYGTWAVTAVYLPAGWKSTQDQHDDVAILRVAPRAVAGVKRRVEDVTGGLRLASLPAEHQKLKITGYNADSDIPIACDARALRAGDFPAFHCDGFVTGNSGSPWIIRAKKKGQPDRVSGVIGGWQLGGCTATTSFSPPFGVVERALLARAEQGGTGDAGVVPADDGCGDDG